MGLITPISQSGCKESFTYKESSGSLQHLGCTPFAKPIRIVWDGWEVNVPEGSRASPCHPLTKKVVSWCCQPFQNAFTLTRKARSSTCPGVSAWFSCRDPFFPPTSKETFWPSWPSAVVSATFLGFFLRPPFRATSQCPRPAEKMRTGVNSLKAKTSALPECLSLMQKWKLAPHYLIGTRYCATTGVAGGRGTSIYLSYLIGLQTQWNMLLPPFYRQKGKDSKV